MTGRGAEHEILGDRRTTPIRLSARLARLGKWLFAYSLALVASLVAP